MTTKWSQKSRFTSKFSGTVGGAVERSESCGAPRRLPRNTDRLIKYFNKKHYTFSETCLPPSMVGYITTIQRWSLNSHSQDIESKCMGAHKQLSPTNLPLTSILLQEM